MTSATYHLLFTVELLHKYFTSQACSDFTIIPSAQTMEVLKGHKIIVKQYEHRLYAGVQLNGPNKPFLLPEEGMRLTFFLRLNNPLFFNYTNLPFSYPPGKIYYFTNRNANTNNGKHFLTRPIGYLDGVLYKPGELAANAAHTAFQAVRHTNAAPPAGDATNADWMLIDKNSYLTENDALQWMPSVSTYTFDEQQPSATVAVYGYNSAEAEKYSTQLLSKTISFPEPVKTFKLDLSALPPGKYRLEVNGAKQLIYLNDELSLHKDFAVIDMYHESTLPDGYTLLDDSGTLKSPVYTVYFLNRATIWKYILAIGQSGSISDNASIYQFENSMAGAICSLSPIPLSEKALSLALTIDGRTYSSPACAAPQRLAKEKDVADMYYSEIYLNY